MVASQVLETAKQDEDQNFLREMSYVRALINEPTDVSTLCVLLCPELAKR